MTEPLTSAALAKWIALTAWSIAGGVVHALIEQRKGKVASFVDGLILAVISGFAGAMWGLLAVKFFGDDIITIAFASGLGGFASVEGLVILINTIKQKYLK